mgnify:CR=1 FL=1
MSKILFKKGKGKNLFDIYIEKTEGNIEKIVTIVIPLSSSLYNNFKYVSIPIEEMSVIFGDEFVNFFYNLFMDYLNNNRDPSFILNKIDTILDYSCKYIDNKNYDYKKFINEKKKSKTSIVFSNDEVRSILICSMCFKIYSLFNTDENLKLPDSADREFKDTIIEKLNLKDTIYKIYTTMKSRIYRSSLLDKSIWDIVRKSVFKTPDEHSLKLFNHFCNDLFPLLEPDSNPISYMVKVTDDSIRWLLSTVYKNTVIFDPESFVSVEDMFGGGISKDVFYMFACNDVLDKYAKKGMEILEIKYKVAEHEERFLEIRDILDKITSFPPSSSLVLYPLIMKYFNVPYKYIERSSPRILTLIGIYFKETDDDFNKKYPILSNYLGVYSDDRILSTKSLYKVKSIDNIINNTSNIFGLTSSVLKYEIVSSVCGVILSNRKYLKSVLTNKHIPKFNSLDLENEILSFLFEDFNLNSVQCKCTKF